MITAEQAQQWEADIASWRHRVEAVRVKTIEECARVAESHTPDAERPWFVTSAVAAAIRALKDKT